MSTTPPAKVKKLVQARLPFLSANSPGSPVNVNKKRKLTSPSPTSVKNEKGPKLAKISKNENVIKKEKDDTKAESSDGVEIIEIDKPASVKLKKSESNLMLKFLQQGSRSSSPPSTALKKEDKTKNKEYLKVNTDVKLPRIILDRCDKVAQSRMSSMEIDNDSNSDDENEIEKGEDDNTSNVENKNKNVGDEKTDEDINNDEIIGDSNDKSVQLDSECEILSSDEESEESEDKKDSESHNDIEDRKEKMRKVADCLSSADEDEGNRDIKDSEKSEVDSKTKEIKKREGKDALKDGVKKPMTPKQLARHKEKLKRLEELQKQKDERNEERMKQRALKEAEREQKRKEKEKEKELKDLKKQMEIKQKKVKEEERRKREEAKEEEKRKKEEEKLEAERKKQKAAESFVSFFVTKKQETKPLVEDKIIRVHNFMPFEIKADMKVAPTCRRLLNDEEKSSLDELYVKNNLDYEKLYLKQVKNNEYKVGRSGKTFPIELKDEIIILDEDDIECGNVVDGTSVIEKHRPKLLLFSENRRPPYWGTWRKKSGVINPRKPFTKDINWFDYEIDSDEEWEEEEPGESLHGSDDEKDEENPDDDEYDVDNEFMVPHGYLSDEEARPDDEEDRENICPETQQFKLKVLGEQFEAEMKEKTYKLKPKVIGCIWLNSDNSYPENTPQSVIKFLKEREVWTHEIPIDLLNISKIENETTNKTDTTSNMPSTSTASASASASLSSPAMSKKTKVPDEAIPDLIRLIHCNVRGSKFLIKEFITYWQQNHNEWLSKVSVGTKIRDLAKRIACPDEGVMHLKTCWYVPEGTRKMYHEEDLKVPNQWVYILNPNNLDKSKSNVDTTEVGNKVDKDKKDDQSSEKVVSKDKEKKSNSLITQFAKKLSQEEMKEQLSVSPSTQKKPSISLNRPPKRVALISVPRGEPASTDSNKIVTSIASQNPTTGIQIQDSTDKSQKIDVDSQQTSVKIDQKPETNETKDEEVL